MNILFRVCTVMFVQLDQEHQFPRNLDEKISKRLVALRERFSDDFRVNRRKLIRLELLKIRNKI